MLLAVLWVESSLHLFVCVLALLQPAPAAEQPAATNSSSPTLSLDADNKPVIATPDKIQVKPVAIDQDISGRLSRIFTATGWFRDINIRTDEGVVFLAGVAGDKSRREWAESVAQKTSDVVAVVNNITVEDRPILDFGAAIISLKGLWRELIQLLPLLGIGLIVVFISYGLSKTTGSLAGRLASKRMHSQLLQQMISSVIAVMVMLVGLYIALKVSGLSRLAVTVLGGTGLVGIAIGFAFRDIAENYLASILISLNRPFNVGDLIEVGPSKGFVRQVTTRGTLLLTVDGNHIQIPNSTIYKSTITNYSASPRIRKEFMLGIGYDDSVSDAQSVLLKLLKDHDSVIEDPAPLILVDSLGSSTVNLKALFWLDAERFDAAAVCSALMRQAKTALAEANISMPDEAREVVFPLGVPVSILQEDRSTVTSDAKIDERSSKRLPKRIQASDQIQCNSAEGNLENPKVKVQQHAKSAEQNDSENLIN